MSSTTLWFFAWVMMGMAFAAHMLTNHTGF